MLVSVYVNTAHYGDNYYKQVTVSRLNDVVFSLMSLCNPGEVTTIRTFFRVSKCGCLTYNGITYVPLSITQVSRGP